MICVRIKEARQALKLSQPEASAKSGIPVGTLRKYEQGSSQPGAEAIAGLVRLGINANWLLTGEGSMLLADLATLPAQSQSMSFAFDQERLEKSLEAVEAGLAAAGSTMAPSKKAAVVLAVYDLMQEPSVTSERVLKLIKLAA